MKGPNGDNVVHRGTILLNGAKLIHPVKAHVLLNWGYEGYLCNIVDFSATQPSTENILIVCEFPGTFLDEIPDIPPAREVYFYINLSPRVALISKAPY